MVAGDVEGVMRGPGEKMRMGTLQPLSVAVTGHLGTKSLVLPIAKPTARQPHMVTPHICQSGFQGTLT